MEHKHMGNVEQTYVIPLPKLCRYCNKLKKRIEFSKNTKAPDGLQYRCKSCLKDYLVVNSDHAKKRKRDYYLKKKGEDPELNKTIHKERVEAYNEALKDPKFEIPEVLLEKMRHRIENEQKYCIGCKKTYEITNFYIRIRYGKHLSVRSLCKDCHNKATVNEAKKRPVNNTLVRYKREAGKKGLEFNLTLDFVRDSLNSPCTYCNESDILMTVDRKDSAIGYITSNCTPCCIRCNLVKCDMPYDAWMVVASSMKSAREAGLFGDWKGRRNFNFGLSK